MRSIAPGSTSVTRARRPRTDCSLSATEALERHHVGHDVREDVLVDLEADLEVVEVLLAVDDDEVVRAHALDLEEHVLDLAGEHVDAADDEHVVGALAHLAHARQRAPALAARRVERRQVVGAVAQEREGLLGERRDDELALLAVRRAAPRSPGRRPRAAGGPR